MSKKKSCCGFASMDKEKQKQIASMGGKKAHATGNAYEWNSTTASLAGKQSWKNRKPGNQPQSLLQKV